MISRNAITSALVELETAMARLEPLAKGDIVIERATDDIDAAIRLLEGTIEPTEPPGEDGGR